MIVQVGSDAAGVVPVFAEPEEAIGIVRPLSRRAQPHFPVDEVLTFAGRARFRLDGVIPLTLS